MLKNVIFCGASRSGKSSTAQALREKIPLNYYPIDPMINAFESIYPELGITHVRANDEEISKRFSPFLWKLLRNLFPTGKPYTGLGGHGYLIDTCYVLPAEIADNQNENLIVAFFGYPNLTAEIKFEQIRTHEAPEDWTASWSDEQLMDHLIRWVEDSKYYERECARFGIRFFDTSEDLDDIVKCALSWSLRKLQNP